MSTAIIICVLALICGYSIWAYVKKLRYGGGCCGEHDAPEKKVAVTDKDKANYPYTVVLSIDGMTCSNCVRRVENALNRLDGVWAQVDLEKRQATVRMKQQLTEDQLRQTVRQIGYTVLSMQNL